MRAKPTLLLGMLVLAAAVPAIGAPQRVLKVACVAPEGSSWAHELRAFANEIEAATAGALKIKLYLGGIAGGELEVLNRIERNQLDGSISGGMLCSRLSPTLRVMRMIGLFRDRSEAIAVIGRLKPTVDEEFRSRGYLHLGGALVGMDVLFSRGPLRNLDDLRKTRFWIWDLDEVVQAQLKQMGIPFVPSPLPDAADLYRGNQVDGFFTVPGAALAYQWSAQAKYLGAYRLTALAGCAFLTSRAYDALPTEARAALQAATAKLQVRFNDTTEAQDRLLVDSLFAKQGLVPQPASPAFAAELSRAADEAVRAVGDKLLPAGVLERVRHMLDERRAAQH